MVEWQWSATVVHRNTIRSLRCGAILAFPIHVHGKILIGCTIFYDIFLYAHHSTCLCVRVCRRARAYTHILCDDAVFIRSMANWLTTGCVCCERARARFFVCLMQFHAALSISIFATYQKIENFLLMQFTSFASARTNSLSHTHTHSHSCETKRSVYVCWMHKIHGFPCCCVHQFRRSTANYIPMFQTVCNSDCWSSPR